MPMQKRWVSQERRAPRCVCLSLPCAHEGPARHVSYGDTVVEACPLPGSTSMSPSDSSGLRPRGLALCRDGPPGPPSWIGVASQQPGAHPGR